MKPYWYVNVVTSTGTFTNGGLTSSLVALPACERAQIVVTGNTGVGVKLNFKNTAIFSTLGINPKTEFSLPVTIMKRAFTGWKNPIKCPGD